MSALDPSDVRSFKGTVIEYGMKNEHKIEVVRVHNEYREKIMKGEVPNQPKGKNLKTMSYDEELAVKARPVCNSLKMNHIEVNDSRFSVGQNIYMSMSSNDTPGPNWTVAVTSWYNEYKNFKYPNTKNGVVGHYTQVIWADTNLIGCDYVMYKDPSNTRCPYVKLYACNYGPAGNWVGQNPYPLA